MLPGRVDLEAYRGDSWVQPFRFLYGDTPVDLTGASVASEARLPSGARATLRVEVGTPETSGEIELRLPEAGMPVGLYDYDVEVTDAGGAVTTWVRGELRVIRDVTHEREAVGP